MAPTFSMEIWKDVPGYEGLYQVSDQGNVKSLNYKRSKTEKLLTPITNKRIYLYVFLTKNKLIKIYKIHVLVAMAFLGFKPNGHTLVVNHINFNKRDNRLVNLEITTNRANCSHLVKKGTSQYTGVCWSKHNKSWSVEIQIKGKKNHLGYFKDELDAHNAYQNKLKTVT